MDRFYTRYEPKNNLPNREYIIPNQSDKEFKELASAVCVTNEVRQNLIPSQKKILWSHFRLIHIMLQYVKWLIFTGCMNVQVNANSVANCESPKCDVCEFGKFHRIPNKINNVKENPMKYQEINKDHILPGHMFSSYHYISWYPVRIYHKRTIQIHLRCSQASVSLLNIPVVI